MVQPDRPQEESLAPVAFGATVTILFSDIRGFTEYTEEHGDEAAYRMLQHHNTLIEEQIALYGGHIVKSLGDSYMVSFDAARTAVTCAVAMQRAMQQYNRTQQGSRIEIGVGINTGEPVRDEDDLFGGAVNLASRICAAAEAGRVLVSETVRHVVGRMEGSEWIDRGSFEIKGFHEPQRLFEMDWSGATAVRATRVAPPLGVAGPAVVAPPPQAPPPLPQVPTKRRRLWLPWAGAAAALLVATGLVGGVVFLAGREAVPSGLKEPEAAKATAALSSPIAQKGALVYEAKLDGTGNDVQLPRYIIGDPAASDIRFPRGAIEVAILKRDGNTGVNLNTGARLRYAVEYDLSVEPGSDLTFHWNIRWGRPDQQASYVIRVDALNEFVDLVYHPNTAPAKIESLAGRIPVRGLQTGKVVTLMAIVDEGRYTLFLDGNQVADVVDTRLSEPTVPGLAGYGMKGVVRIRGARVYELVGAAIAVGTAGASAAQATSPGKPLRSDDFSDPAKGLFLDNQRGTGRVTFSTGASHTYQWEYSYVNGALVGRIKGPYPENPDGRHLGSSAGSFGQMVGDFAVEARARAAKSPGQTQYAIQFRFSSDDLYQFAVKPGNGSYRIWWQKERRNLVEGRSSAVNPGKQDNHLRMKVRGDTMTVFVNGQEVGRAQHEGLAKRGGTIALVWSMFGPPAEGDVEVRFTDFKVYSLEP